MSIKHTLIRSLRLFAILMLALALSVSVQVWSRIQVGEGIASRTIPFRNVVENPKGRVLFAGDSTAYGTGARSNKNSTAGRFASRYPGYEVENLAINGLKLEGFVEIMNAHERKYDLVVMQIGANDVLRFASIEDLHRNAHEAIGAAKAKSENVIWIAVGNVGATRFFPWPLSIVYDYWSVASINTLKYIADEESVHYIDLYKERGDSSFYDSEQDLYSRDGLHLSDYGYGLWFQEIERVIEEEGLLK